jgi:hypothetical protein
MNAIDFAKAWLGAQGYSVKEIETAGERWLLASGDRLKTLMVPLECEPMPAGFDHSPRLKNFIPMPSEPSVYSLIHGGEKVTVIKPEMFSVFPGMAAWADVMSMVPPPLSQGYDETGEKVKLQEARK